MNKHFRNNTNLARIATAFGVPRRPASGPAGEAVAQLLPTERLKRAKPAFTTRRVDLTGMAYLLRGDIAPLPGDLVLARVTRIGQHTRIELPTGRRARLYAGDEIVVAYGNRYASDQFEALVPGDLSPCHLVAGGGIASRCISRNSKMKKATEIEPIGLLSADGINPSNLRDWALHVENGRGNGASPSVIAVVGTGMNAGKTTTACDMIHGLSAASMKVASAKITGTGSGGDVWYMTDAGANPVLDFTDAGHASTFGIGVSELLSIMHNLVAEMRASDPDVIVLEIADGLLQKETAELLGSEAFGETVDCVIFAAGDSMGAVQGVEWLRSRNLPVVAISGVVSSSPLGARETEDATGLPVFDKRTLVGGSEVAAIVLRQYSQEAVIGGV